ncbi:MAG: cytochrome c [Gammaproteobacteria bacterium]|nr:cytochrome c [Gammaproteobacteria bacterium]
MSAAHRCAGGVALLALGALAAAADGSAPLNADQLMGQSLFRATCSYCHAAGGWGTRELARRLGTERSVLLERTDLDPAYIRIVVRRGLNSMPAYTPTDLTERQIASIADYLTRNSPAASTGSR